MCLLVTYVCCAHLFPHCIRNVCSKDRLIHFVLCIFLFFIFYSLLSCRCYRCRFLSGLVCHFLICSLFSFCVSPLYRGFPRSHRLYYIEHTHTKWKHNNRRNNQWQQWQQQYQSNKCLTMINLFGTENSVFILFWMNALHVDVDVCVSTRVEYGLVLYISKSKINS